MTTRASGCSLLVASLLVAVSAWASEPEDLSTGTKERKSSKVPHLVTSEATQFWSFRPIQRPRLPGVENRAWVRNPVDVFVLAKLEEKGIAPAAPAERRALLRRAYYDLLGLPPAPEEVDRFLGDDSPDAFAKLVDRLLSSPQYGERWGRHWLDVVRYAETNSFERDTKKPNAWRYRDYVIRSLNGDKPYDQFVREQLAGDELDEVTPETIIATGFYRLGPWDDEPTDKLQAEYDELDDIVTTTSQAFLGLTLNCARCHDHKMDPVPQQDYYRMLAFFHGILPTERMTQENTQTIISRGAKLEAYWDAVERRRQEVVAVKQEIELIEVTLQGKEGDAEDLKQKHKVLQKKLRELEKRRLPPVERALSVKGRGPLAPKTHLLVRGNAHVKAEEVRPAFPEVLGAPLPEIPEASPTARSCGRRRVLADWIASEKNQLTARVMVNRVWHYHFGRGIVRTPNNFGKVGAAPTHPKLLDWLAREFVDNGWRLKPLHRLIMTSNTYQMSSYASEETLRRDPENDLFSRMEMRRLGAEEIRDSLLAVSGTLNLNLGGPSAYPKIQQDVLQTQSRPGHGWNTSPMAEQRRRSVYVHVKRTLLLPLLSAFDFADTDMSCPVRFQTTQPTQALTMMNGAMMNSVAVDFAERLRREVGQGDETALVSRAYRLTLGRSPSDHEVESGVQFIQGLQNDDGVTEEVALQFFSLLVLNLNEFLYID